MRERTALANLSPAQVPLKFLLVGTSGSGKTHLIGTYTQGPIHVYSFDPGGILTLKKSANPNITYDEFIDQDIEIAKAYTAFAKTWNSDQKEGLFQDLAKSNGILVIDSLSTLSQAALDYVVMMEKLAGKKVDIISPKLWGQQMVIIKQVIRELNALPCMAICTAHELIMKDEAAGTIRYYPLVTGNLRDQVGLYFSEVYGLSQTKKGTTITFFPSYARPVLKTRIFRSLQESLDNANLDTIISGWNASLTNP